MGSAKCGDTFIYDGSLYSCASQTAGVAGETTGCGTAGVYCSTTAPDHAGWGSAAWTKVQDCE